MNKLGFTLVELLAVITLIAVIMLIAFPGLGNISDKVNEEMLNTKVKLIEEASTLLGDNIKGSIMASNKKYDGYLCRSILVKDLVPDYLNKDNDKACSQDGEVDSGCIEDPRKDNTYLDNMEIIVFIKNNRVKSIVDIDNDLSCE